MSHDSDKASDLLLPTKLVYSGFLCLIQAAEKMGEVSSVAMVIEECGGLDKLENLQTHENEQIYQKVVQLIDNYFSNVSDDSFNVL